MSLMDLPVMLNGKPIRTKAWELFPKIMGGELQRVKTVLESDQWFNGNTTKLFEKALAEYLGIQEAVAVNTGGMAIQIALRTLGISPGDEVLMQVDTCTADAFAVFNAGAVPVFADSDPETFMLDWNSVEDTIGPRTKAIIPVHIWGRPANLDQVQEITRRHDLLVLDDACLACGAEWRDKRVGTFGHAGVFSFGCLKPFQAGGGGAIVTDDVVLAREMRVSRSWGEMQHEYGIRDQKELAWNGRIPEIVCAVLLEQLKGYPKYLTTLQENAALLEERINDLPGIRIFEKDERITAQAHTQFLFKVDESELGMSREVFARALEAEGLPLVWHAAFEPMTTLSFFKEYRWRKWVGDPTQTDRLTENYHRPYPGSELGYQHIGMSIGRNVLCSGSQGIKDTVDIIERICTNADRLMKYSNSL
jgi:perosamine synthetase